MRLLRLEDKLIVCVVPLVTLTEGIKGQFGEIFHCENCFTVRSQVLWLIRTDIIFTIEEVR